ncbi:MAG: hypothetical protein COT26_03535 [Candidatus Kerfeldbacteria bacterium CG08_land_8_20_14_0_20_43_14]|uniref:NTP pyrophosphohydrolase MazG-like domain-containing protein n=1 Tax=Candidatus Kerfeldbacteria bacterium CG08_land_8_20_14_0_20_43_14 TaxID=2014246 RepID=A0A2H0YPL0_9BACT|nr:MAG: hypothetical protein COT26_03535 [Candidatus Kerfeldbacteria bacterium CG08_land_8_20_14_0_20_43_14]
MHQQKIVDQFMRERGWHKYHTPKELLLGMVEEIGEFRNIIKWSLEEETVKKKIMENHAEVENFFGDMLWELSSLANYCQVNLSDALDKVIEEHKVRFPMKSNKWK